MSPMQSTNEGSNSMRLQKTRKIYSQQSHLSYEHDLCSVWENVLCHGNDAPETG